jgi:hypothetical protein
MNNNINNKDEINDIVKLLEVLDEQINKSFKNIDMFRKKKKDYQEKLYKICNHDWKPDRSYNNYDHTPFYCTICGLDS